MNKVLILITILSALFFSSSLISCGNSNLNYDEESSYSKEQEEDLSRSAFGPSKENHPDGGYYGN